MRLSRSDSDSIENLGGWLATVVARVCLDVLRARKARREEPLDAHVPGPSVSRADGAGPEHEAALADSVGLALHVVLETLPPAQRVAFVLHDTFGVPFDEIAPILGCSPAAARQLASRARRRVQGAAVGTGANLTRQRSQAVLPLAFLIPERSDGTPFFAACDRCLISRVYGRRPYQGEAPEARA